jgi:uncharacterized protein YukE
VPAVDPADLDDLARTLDTRAGAVQSYVDTLRQRFGQATWQGPVADRFRTTIQDVTTRLQADGDQLSGAATAVRKVSAALQAEIAQLHTVETNVRAWLASNPVGVSATPPPWPPTDLPPPGDPRWRQVQQAFRAAGIPT